MARRLMAVTRSQGLAKDDDSGSGYGSLAILNADEDGQLQTRVTTRHRVSESC